MANSAEKQVEMSGKTWAVLKEHGVTEQTPLVLDLFWFAHDAEAAQKLVNRLQGGVAHFAEAQMVDGLWSVKAQTAPRPFSLPAIEKLVRDMAELATAHQCDFDGWGAQIPEPARQAAKKPWWKLW